MTGEPREPLPLAPLFVIYGHEEIRQTGRRWARELTEWVETVRDTLERERRR